MRTIPTTIRTPFMLKFLLHCHTSIEVFGELHSTAGSAAVCYLLNETAMIKEMPDRPKTYELTDKGQAFLDHLLQIPFPQVVWTIPEVKQ